MRQLVFPLLLFHLGCAQITSERDEISPKVTATYRETSQSLGLVNLAADGWDGTARVAVVSQEVLCETTTFQDTETTTTHVVETSGAGMALFLGGVSLAGGAIALASAPSLSTDPNYTDEGKEVLSDQMSAYVWGSLGAALGAGIVGHAIYVKVREGSTVRNVDTQSRVPLVTTPPKVCDARPYTGRLVVSVGGKERTIHAENGRIRVPLETGDCPQPNLKATFEDGRTTSLDVGACFAAQKMEATIERISNRLETFDDLKRILRAYDQAIEDVAAMEQTAWKQHAASLIEARKARFRDAMISETLKVLSDPSKSAFICGDNSDGTEIVALTESVSQRSGDIFGAWLAAYTKNCVQTSTRALQAELKAFPDDYQACTRHEPCAHPKLRELWERHLSKHFDGLARDLERHVNFVERQQKTLKSATELSAFRTFVEQLDELDRFRAQHCVHGLNTFRLGVACAATVETVPRGHAAIEQERARLQGLVAKSTTKQWRALFPICRRLAKDIEALNSVRRCDNECLAARSKMVEEARKLRDFAPDPEVYTPESRSTLDRECREAGCPTCPGDNE